MEDFYKLENCSIPDPNNQYNFVFDTNVLSRLPLIPNIAELFINARERGFRYYSTDVQGRELIGTPDRNGNYNEFTAWKPDENLKIINSYVSELKIERISCVATLLYNFWVLDGSMRLVGTDKNTEALFNDVHNKNIHHLRDAVIAEATIYNNCILVTTDSRLYKKVNKHFPGRALLLDDFIGCYFNV